MENEAKTRLPQGARLIFFGESLLTEHVHFLQGTPSATRENIYQAPGIYMNLHAVAFTPEENIHTTVLIVAPRRLSPWQCCIGKSTNGPV